MGSASTTSINRIAQRAVIALICAASILIAAPAIDRNADDPDLIAYFNHDEGFLMDLAWFYYSGEKRESFQYECDYGVELLYLTDLSRNVLSRFVEITPGKLVLILRWAHLVFWIMALLALWRLVNRHFAQGWPPVLIVALLAARPAFPYLSQNLKPEPVVLFFMIIGLDYALRIIDRPSVKYAAIAAACAAFAAVIKFVGIFLLPALVLVMYLTERRFGRDASPFPRLAIAQSLPVIIGAVIILLPVASILGYVRQSTGMTWYAEFGFWGSVVRNRMVFYLFGTGCICMSVSYLIRLGGRSGNALLKRAAERSDSVVSNGFLATLIFSVFVLIFGVRWVIDPSRFLQMFAATGTEAFSGAGGRIAAHGVVPTMARDLAVGIGDFGPVLFALFLVYLFVEIRSLRRQRARDNPAMMKRLTLACFVAPAILCMVLPLRLKHHHLLPFIAAGSILGLCGAEQALREISGTGRRRGLIALFSALFAASLLGSALNSARSFSYLYHWRDDAVFDIARWWRDTYPSGTSVVADHPVWAYMPPEYTDVRRLPFNSNRSALENDLEKLVLKFKPRLIYLNTGSDKAVGMTRVEEMFRADGITAHAVRSFDAADHRYRRWPGSTFIIYEIIYPEA